MVKILIVEDTPAKAERLRKCVQSVAGIKADDVHLARDLVGARELLNGTSFDLMVLDIRVPNIAGDDAEEGGAELIRELRASSYLVCPYHIIGITAYDDTLESVQQLFDDELWKVLKYDPTSRLWEQQLKRKVEYLVRSKEEMSKSTERPYLYDVAIVTALHDPELRAVLRLDAEWSEVRIPNDHTSYHTGAFEGDGKSIRVVAAAAPQMGMSASAVLSMKMIANFRPRYIAMVGIAAGMPEVGRDYGDLLVAERCWNYESGKRAVSEERSLFVPEPTQVPLNTALREKFLGIQASRKYLNQIQEEWDGDKIDFKLKISVGPVASGSAVVADANIRDGIKDQQQRKVIGIEMESYAVYYAAENCSLPQPIAFSVKSVCDFANAEKDNKYHRYAAFTSARFLYRFALGELDVLG
jgi:nucleoside phosphorylase